MKVELQENLNGMLLEAAITVLNSLPTSKHQTLHTTHDGCRREIGPKYTEAHLFRNGCNATCGYTIEGWAGTKIRPRSCAGSLPKYRGQL
jgi:hypothetical protein